MPHTVTQIVQSVAFNNSKLITKKDCVYPKYNNEHSESQTRQVRQLEPRDKVLILNLRERPKLHSATVVQKLEICVYYVYIDKLDVIWK